MDKGEGRLNLVHFQDLSASYIVIAQCGLEERHPGARVGIKHGRLHLGMSLVEEVEGLGEAAQNNGIDDAKGEHVTSDHGIYHGHKGSGQANGAESGTV